MNTVALEPIRIGVLFSQTGVTSVIERGERMGTILAVEEINEAGGIDGRPLRLVSLRPGVAPVRYQATRRETDPRGRRAHHPRAATCRAPRKAVIPVVEKWHALLVYPTLYEGFEYSRNVVYTGARPNQNSVQLAEFMLRTYGSRVFMVGSDYIYPVRVEPHHERPDPGARRREGRRALPAVERRMGRLSGTSRARSNGIPPTSSSRRW